MKLTPKVRQKTFGVYLCPNLSPPLSKYVNPDFYIKAYSKFILDIKEFILDIKKFIVDINIFILDLFSIILRINSTMLVFEYISSQLFLIKPLYQMVSQ